MKCKCGRFTTQWGRVPGSMMRAVVTLPGERHAPEGCVVQR